MIVRFLLTTILIMSAVGARAEVLKLATLSPDGSYWMDSLRNAGKEIEKRTDGRVKLKFYPSGVMGDDKAVLRKMRIHQLSGGVFTANAVAEYNKDIQAYNLLFKFKNLEEVDYVRQRMDQEVIEGLERGGLTSYGLAEIGFAYVMSTRPSHSLADLRSQKTWVPDNDAAAMDAVRAFRINPIPLAFGDVLVALQSGMLETVAASPLAAVALQWHTQIKYLIDMPLLYVFATLAIDNAVIGKLTPQDQQTMKEVMSRALQNIDQQNRKDNLSALDVLKKRGIQFTVPTRDGIAEIQTLAASANETTVKSGVISADAAARIDQLLKEYRTKNAQSR